MTNELPSPEHDTFVLPRRRPTGETADLDITPMIDVTFLLLIFFLVASVPDPNTAVSLPPARHGATVGLKASTIITVGQGRLSAAPVFLADGRVPEAQLSTDPAEQAQQVREAVLAGLQEGKSNVLIKAEKGVSHGDVARVAAAISLVEGVRLHVAILEEN